MALSDTDEGFIRGRIFSCARTPIGAESPLNNPPATDHHPSSERVAGAFLQVTGHQNAKIADGASRLGFLSGRRLSDGCCLTIDHIAGAAAGDRGDLASQRATLVTVVE